MKYEGTLKNMIIITDEISISEEELKFKFVRSSGPGGQNVNKVSTAVQLRFDVVGSSTLPSDIRSRLMTIAGNRVTENGVLVIDAQQYSSQSQNRQAAIDRPRSTAFDQEPNCRSTTIISEYYDTQKSYNHHSEMKRI